MESEDPPQDQLQRRDWLTIFLTSAGVLMVVMDSTIVNVALPIIREDLGFLEVSVSDLQWVVNAYALSFAVLLLSAGRLADLFGRKRLFLIGLVLFTGASIACGAANEINVLIGFRVLQGIGAALIMPTTISILQVSIPVSKLGLAIGIWSAVVGLGTAIGPLAGGILAEQVDWRWVFFINVPIGLVVFVGTLGVIVESRSDAKDRRLDVVGALISAASLFLITFSLLKATSFGWGDPRTLGCLGVGLVGLVAFVFYERRHPAPMLDMSLFRSSSFAGANVVAVFVGFTLFGLLFFGSFFIQSVMGFSATDTGLSLLPMMAMIIFIGPVAGKLVGKIGPGPLLTVGMAMLAIAHLFFARLSFDSDFWTLLPAMIAAGVGFALVLTPLTAAALSSVPIQQAGVGAAMINSTRQVGGAIGLAVLGAISAQVISATLTEGDAAVDGFVDSFGLLMLTGAGVALTGSLVAWVTIIRPARVAAAAAAASAGAEPADDRGLAQPEGISVEQPQSWAVAVPSVVTSLPPSLARRYGVPRPAPTLEVVAGPLAGTRIPLADRRLVLGRGEGRAGGLGDDEQLSRRHASVSRAEAGVLVEDLGSTNGTRVGGRDITEPTVVEDGDTFAVGMTTLRVVAPQMPAGESILGAGLAIEVVGGPASGVRIPIHSEPLIFGRGEPGAGGLADDPELSRRHASASLLDPGRVLVEDLGSTNGTFVNEHRIVAPTVIGRDDGLRIGTSTLKVVARNGSGQEGSS